VWRTITSTPGRLLLSVGLILGFGAVGTMAYWTDQATLSTGTISSGSLDLQIGGRNSQTGQIAWDKVGEGTRWNYAVVELDNVAPGESVAMELHIRNVGSVPLTFTGTGATTTSEMGQHLTASTTLGGAASNSGTREAVDRKGTCSAGETWWTSHVLTETPSPVTPNNRAIRLDPQERIQVCMLAGFSASAPPAFQGASTTIEVVFDAKQVGAP